MNKEEMFELMKNNPAFHLATIEGNRPHCRGMFLFRADENGIIFHTGAMKDVYKQINENPNVELCFNDFKNNIQVRVSGQLEEVDDNAFKDEICAHPSRGFLKPWRESGPLNNFYSTFKVFRLKSGAAIFWTMATNFAPKVTITL
ncbi:MAG: pyridoxamine 5'-phosphate oxidase [Spirochaetes bacterium GWF1_31_7]|nr:MAG: pyridoxamine 5'-phosphate oxidase [Spirochaetes bacterium GWE1_32_154]OHD44711.1 MAG: pyridoxamine 5'-phosphate oxidase [Spirochaetes bacterium GWE2_31_10]OHD48916.1 MAG: pyridoxamine 5'-phosphate oxidase [Spirochaetes bacterium GWF1_31_7]OHD80276.1 MAG: pyridoxamine 5'-phosphate oxidase [Spirochaetes bacterium RIFOXYB1_FULL_32_8]HBD92634.1 pyridoxamine 5'-phosphate oxidase [Spirochaetia bacterium]